MTCQLVGRALTKPANASTSAGVMAVRFDTPPQHVVSTLLPPIRKTAGAIWPNMATSVALLETNKLPVNWDFS